MWMLVLGLFIFLATHSVRVFAEPWRRGVIERQGANQFKVAYSVVSLAGFLLIIYGYGMARQAPVVLYSPPIFTKHIAALLTLVAFILLTAAYVPGTKLKAAVKHPMVLGVKTWAFAHLLANGTLHDVLLFGSFLVWAVLSFRAARKRDAADRISYPPGSAVRDVVNVIIGTALWAGVAFWAHGAWIGVRPFGM
jgi:uncharacterized membrane protein